MRIRKLTARQALIWMALCIAPGICFGQDGPAASDERVIVGYLYGPPRKINFSLYTHLCHAFLIPEESGAVRTSRLVPNERLAKEAHAAGVKVLVALGGWGWDREFAAIARDEMKLDRFVDAVMTIVSQHDYDGVDVDWEYPDTADEIAGFEQLVRRFRARLNELGKAKGRKMFQTAAVSASPDKLKWFDKDMVQETLDWLNVMTYDFAGDWTSYAGHHSPLFASSKQPGTARHSTALTMEYLLRERRFPPRCLALGIPLYGRGFAAPMPYSEKQKGSPAKIPRGEYANLHRLLNNEGWERQWDEETKSPWLLSPDRTVVIGFDDAESVSLKARWAAENGLRGVFYWEIGADRLPDGTNPLQESARRAFNEKQPR